VNTIGGYSGGASLGHSAALLQLLFQVASGAQTGRPEASPTPSHPRLVCLPETFGRRVTSRPPGDNASSDHKSG
jgi:hypothetical protein